MPLEVQGHTVPYLKAAISGKNEPIGLRCGSSFRVQRALLKSAILLHKEGLVKTAVPITVHINLKKIIAEIHTIRCEK